MGVHIPELEYSYFSVPKCACTSLKAMFFEIENGFEFRRFKVNGKGRFVHHFYPSRPFDDEEKLVGEGFKKVAVVRDPVSRVVSCYRNRVGRKGGAVKLQKRKKALGKAGVPVAPTLQEFVDGFEAYREIIQDVRHHSQPLTHFLGKDPAFFDKIYNLKQLEELRKDLEGHVDLVPELKHLQTRGAKVSKDDLSDANVAKIKKFYAEDYDLYGRWFEAA